MYRPAVAEPTRVDIPVRGRSIPKAGSMLPDSTVNCTQTTDSKGVLVANGGWSLGTDRLDAGVV